MKSSHKSNQPINTFNPNNLKEFQRLKYLVGYGYVIMMLLENDFILYFFNIDEYDFKLD